MSVCKLLYTATLTKSVITSATFFSFRSLSKGHIRHFSLSFSNVITVITPSLYQSAWEGLFVFIRQNFSIARSICNTVSCLSTETSNQILPLHWSLFSRLNLGLKREMCYRRKHKPKSASVQVTECPQHKRASSKQESHFTPRNLKRYSHVLCCSIYYMELDQTGWVQFPRITYSPCHFQSPWQKRLHHSPPVSCVGLLALH